MSFRYIDNGLRKMCALVLVGTIAGGVTIGQVAYAENIENGTPYRNELLTGHYSDEDVKKNREELMFSIASNDRAKVKSFGKRKEIVPKTIVR